METLAFLGLGAMGSRMARRFVDAGRTVRVWNRGPEAAAGLVAADATLSDSPRAAAEGADVVVSMVSDDHAARVVWLDPEKGALACLGEKALAVESSTVSPAWAKELALAVSGRGAQFVEAPVAGSRPQAEAGELIVMLGGGEAAAERAKAALAPIGKAFRYVGPVGQAAILKLTVNSLLGSQIALMAETLALLSRHGFDEKAIAETLAGFPVVSPAAANYARAMAARNVEPMFTVDLMAKDLGYALAMSAEAGGVMPIVETARDVFEKARDAGHGAENVSAVRALYE